MLILCMKETIDQLTTASSVHWHGHVLRREDGHASRTLHFEVEGHRIRRLKRTRKKQIEEESVKVGLRREDALCR